MVSKSVSGANNYVPASNIYAAMGGHSDTRAVSGTEPSDEIDTRNRTRSTSLLSDQRAQSVVIGAILVFALAVVLLGIVQATIIPNANEDVEVQHSQHVRGQMQDLRNNLQRSATTGQDISQGIKIGVDYPPRVLFINPGPASGSLRTEETGNSDVEISIENAKALDGETDDYLDGSEKPFDTGAVIYQPNYNVYRNAPDKVIIENSIVYNKFGGETLLASDQQVVSGKEISLVALDGEVSTSQVPQYTVTTDAVSPSTTTVPITNDGGEVKITIPTQLSQETLIQDVFGTQIDDNGAAPAPGDTACDDISSSGGAADRYIKNCDFDDSGPGEFNTFTLIMESGNTYTLELAKVGLGNQATDTEPTYLIDTQGSGADVALNGRQRIGLQVRDEFNNPIGGQTIDVRVESGDPGQLVYQGSLSGAEVTDIEVGPDGSVDDLYYQAPASTGSSPVTVDIQAKFTSTSYPGPGSNEPEAARVQLQVINASRIDRTVPLFNPGTGIIVQETEIIGDTEGEPKCGASPGVTCEVEVTFENTQGNELVADEGRYLFYNDDTQGSAGTETHRQVKVVESGGDSVTFPIQAELKSATTDGISFSPSSTTTLSFKFEDSGGNPVEVQEGDWFVVTFVVEDKARTYFIAITD